MQEIYQKKTQLGLQQKNGTTVNAWIIPDHNLQVTIYKDKAQARLYLTFGRYITSIQKLNNIGTTNPGGTQKPDNPLKGIHNPISWNPDIPLKGIQYIVQNGTLSQFPIGLTVQT